MQDHLPISVTRVAHSRIGEVDFNHLPFGVEFTDHIFTADYKNGSWHNFRIEPLKPLSVHPGNMAWHYGQAIFEGMKAVLNPQGEPLLFRPDKHIERLNNSALRMSMPPFPKEFFIQGLKMFVELEKHWIPKGEDSALYLRPLMIATDTHVGVRPSQTYKLIVMALPVGPYYSKPLNVLVQTKYIRAVEGGVGYAKTAGNYGAAMYPTRLAKEKGYDQIVWMEPKEFRYVQEAGTMNIFFRLKDRIVTPMLTGAILPGITRDSIIHVLRDMGHTVIEQKVDINELLAAYKRGELIEAFGSGTAAMVANIYNMRFEDYDMHFDKSNWELSLELKKVITDIRNGKTEDKWGWTMSTTGALEAVVASNIQ